jgi:hypothetical protein
MPRNLSVFCHNWYTTFGDANEEGKHPPPDPLLLAYKAANVWAKMTEKYRFFANGEKPDIYGDSSEGNYIAECAFYDGRRGYYKPHSREELGAGLGQPNGYQG